METSVTELLREFPRVRRAVLSGETVIIKSREGDMRLTLNVPPPGSLVGGLKGQLIRTDDEIDRPTTEEGFWDSRL